MLKKSFVVLLLLITPFAQARAMLFCSMMSGELVEQCCCPGHAPRTIPIERDVEAACCEVLIEVSDKDFAGIGTDLPAVKRPGHDVPDMAVVVTPAAAFPDVFALAMQPQSIGTLSFPAPRLYLRTARLRL